MADLYSRECHFYIVPGDTHLLDVGLTFLPQQGMLVEFLDHDTSSTTRYRVQDVILQIEENVTVPAADPPAVDPEYTIARLVSGWRIEVSVVA